MVGSEMTPESASIRRPGRRAAPAVARLVLWVGAFAGLFAMHGLNDHGVSHEISHHSSAVVAASSDTGHAGHGHLAPAVSSPDGGVGRLGLAGQEGPSPEGMASLCLAVLAVAVFLVVAVVVRRPWGVLGRRSASGQPGTATPLGRERDPPCLYRLSIQRC